MTSTVEKENVTQLCMLSKEEIFNKFGISEAGLSAKEAEIRLEESGPNTIRELGKKPSIFQFFDQFKNLFAVLLLIASLLAAVSGMLELSMAIVLIVIINAVVGMLQEHRAGKVAEELKKLVPLNARAIRDDREIVVSAGELVLGDLIILEEGDRVPADARLIESFEVSVSNMALTGESNPQERFSDPVLTTALSKTEIPNIVWMGTTIASGHGKAIIFATGMKTEFGAITNLTQAIKAEPSPLQKEISGAAKTVSIMATLLGIIFFFIGIMLKITLLDAFLFGIGVVVACVPEGLQATISVSLAMGMRRMARRNALVKRLSAVETLGCTTVICSDKTGTITKGEMTVTRAWVNNNVLQVTGVGNQPFGDFILNDKKILISDLAGLDLLLKAALLCNNAKLIPPSNTNSSWETTGDPTEVALIVAAAKLGFDPNLELHEKQRTCMLPFDSKRKMMSSIYKASGKDIAYIKGAPKEVLSRCKYLLLDGSSKNLSSKHREKINAQVDEFAEEGLRVLALAYKEIPQDTNKYTVESVERNLVFIGLMAMLDPPRPEVEDAVETAKRAGIKVVMITGDHELTAKTIASQASIINNDDCKVLTGPDMDRLSDDELSKELDREELVFAKATPENKLRIVSLLKKKGEIVAVTGDGVNDAPALKEADIGVAMGLVGTDVARESADMILLDDNFATIVTAIEEGRGVYSNIKRFTTYIFTSNWPELIPFLAFVLFRIPLALIVMQILAVDLGTDVLPSLALGVEPPKTILMLQPPRSRREKLLDLSMIGRSIFLGAFECIAAMTGALTTWISGGWHFGQALSSTSLLYRKGTTMALTGIVMTQIGNVFALRTSHTSIFKVGFLSNKWVLVGILGELIIISSIVYLTPLQQVFHTVSLSLNDWIFLFMFAPILFLAEETRKFFLRRLHPIEIEA
jgi:potassium/sodium efflux P-type ATPase